MRDGRLADARLAARGLGHAVAPRETATDASGAVYWGSVVPSSDQARTELDLSDQELYSRPFPGAQFRHEITAIERGPGATVDLSVRTYDPGLRLAVGPHVASLVVAPGRQRMTTRLRLDPVRPGVFEGRVRLDLAAAPLPVHGFDGVRHPMLQLQERSLRNTAVLLAPLDFPTLTARVGYHSGAAPHRVTLEPEGRGAGRLQIRWQPAGLTARVTHPVARRLSTVSDGRVRNAVRLVKSALR